MAGEMADMDIAGMWRSMRADPAEAPHPGAHQQVAGEGITIAVTQQCQATLPLAVSQSLRVSSRRLRWQRSRHPGVPLPVPEAPSEEEALGWVRCAGGSSTSSR
jgi:hypothetical protein